MLEKRAVLRAHVPVLIGLQVHTHQRDLVTANVVTLAEAPYEPGAQVWGLWAGEVVVGLMAMQNPAGIAEPEPEDDLEAAYLWRLMIGEGHQGRGFGRAAMGLAEAVARGWGFGRMVLGVSPEAHGNQGFYEALGYRATGRMAWGDRRMERDLI